METQSQQEEPPAKPHRLGRGGVALAVRMVCEYYGHSWESVSQITINPNEVVIEVMDHIPPAPPLPQGEGVIRGSTVTEHHYGFYGYIPKSTEKLPVDPSIEQEGLRL